MTLTYGSAPFGDDPAGRFNFQRSGPASVLYWEPFPKRVRVEFAGETIADSRAVRALHETGHLMKLYFPRADVAFEHLEPTGHHSECPFKGQASYWTVRAGERTAENAVWGYRDPIPSADFLRDHVAFEYDAMDAWYQEDDRVYAHPRDPYHRFDIHHASRRVVVRHDDVVIADSRRPALLFETGLPARYYLHPDDVRVELLERSRYVSQCPYKGAGQHWNLQLDEARIRNVAWSLPEPLGEAEVVRGWFCFYEDRVVVEVDGVVSGST